MAEKTRYSEEELAEFEELIQQKLEKARHELNSLRDSLTHKSDEGTDSTYGASKTLEDGADTAEKEKKKKKKRKTNKNKKKKKTKNEKTKKKIKK